MGFTYEVENMFQCKLNPHNEFTIFVIGFDKSQLLCVQIKINNDSFYIRTKAESYTC